MTFLEWCRTQARRPDSNGDFARDWIADPDRPRAPTFVQMVDYLEDLGAIDAAIGAGKRCYREWKLYEPTYPDSVATTCDCGFDAVLREMEARLMGKPITDPSYVRFHVGRSWEGHRLEDACKCIKAPCGLVENEDPACDQHGIAANKTIRQTHRADQCPGPGEGGGP